MTVTLKQLGQLLQRVSNTSIDNNLLKDLENAGLADAAEEMKKAEEHLNNAFGIVDEVWSTKRAEES